MASSSHRLTVSPITRRTFLARAATIAAAASTPLSFVRAAEPGDRRFRAVIIGHTGKGNYGHDHDLIFNGRDNIRVLAVADPDPAGRRKAASRSGAERQYAGYVEMLAVEKPDLVCVAPRWTHEHHAMGMAALRVGAHVYFEKPLTRTLAEADELLGTAKKAGLKTVVAHQMRLAPNILRLKESIAEGAIGQLLKIRMHGKQDHRAGGEDLIVLGVHLFDLARFYAGDPLWCAARLLEKGREITATDARAATENIGPVAGDEIEAHFGFPNGVEATFTSRASYRQAAGPWGMELIGSRSAFRINMEMIPAIYQLRSETWTARGQLNEWGLWEEDPTRHLPASERGFAAANRRVVDEWLAAIAENRDAACSGEAGMRALEMAMAVFQSALDRSRVYFPLENREHPLEAAK